MGVAEFEKAGIFLINDASTLFAETIDSVDQLSGVRWQVWPDEIVDEKSVQWGDITIIGRSEPIKAYYASGPRTFSFTLMFVASVDADDAGTSEEVNRKVKFLQALAYPRVTPGGLVLTPPIVKLVVGDLISSNCVLKSSRTLYSGTWDTFQRTQPNPATFLPILGAVIPPEEAVGRPYYNLPLITTVSVVLDEVNPLPRSYDDITTITSSTSLS